VYECKSYFFTFFSLILKKQQIKIYGKMKNKLLSHYYKRIFYDNYSLQVLFKIYFNLKKILNAYWDNAEFSNKKKKQQYL